MLASWGPRFHNGGFVYGGNMGEMKMTMSKAGLVVFIMLIVGGTIDLGFVLFGGTGSSVSNFLINAGFKSPVFSIMAGACLSHLFFYMTPESEWLNNTPWLRIKRSGIMMICAVVIYEAVRRIVAAFL